MDNLPPELLRDFVRLEHQRATHRVAAAVDVRAVGSLPHLVPLVEELRREGVHVRLISLDSSTDTLVRRFSESRRPHPLSAKAPADDPGHALVEAIELERRLLSELREISTVIDTSDLRPSLLRAWIRQMVGGPHARLTLVFESFAFKHGVPLDADFVFDVRMLPNPHYERELRPLTGRDAPVAEFLQRQPEVGAMIEQIQGFLQHWLPALENDQRSYLTVAVGCTGGQHRSVYIVEQLAAHFLARRATLVRHRELDARS